MNLTTKIIEEFDLAEKYKRRHKQRFLVKLRMAFFRKLGELLPNVKLTSIELTHTEPNFEEVKVTLGYRCEVMDALVAQSRTYHYTELEWSYGGKDATQFASQFATWIARDVFETVNAGRE